MEPLQSLIVGADVPEPAGFFSPEELAAAGRYRFHCVWERNDMLLCHTAARLVCGTKVSEGRAGKKSDMAHLGGFGLIV